MASEYRKGFSPLNHQPIQTNFRRQVYCLLGVPIDAVNLRQAGEILTGAVAAGARIMLTTPNINNLVAIQRHAHFRDAIIKSELSVADGMPLVWVARLLGIPLRERVAGSDLFDWLARRGGVPLKVYFFGGPDGAAQAACDRLNAGSGAMRCVGAESPGFGTVEELSHPPMIERINQSKADFLVIAMGTQKGHAWIERNEALLQTRVVSHLGAVVNFVGGTLARAPITIRRLGLEWLWRIKEEPALWRRYWNDSRAFVPLIFTRVLPCMTERLISPFLGPGAPARVETSRHGQITRVRIEGSWFAKDLDALREIFETETSESSAIEFDFTSLGRIDEGFIGLLMLVYGHQAKKMGTFRVLSASPAVRRAFRWRCAEFLLEDCPVPDTARGQEACL